MSDINLYNILGIPQNSTSQDIEKAYIKYTKIWIPDDVKITEKYAKIFRLIHDSYTILINPISRKAYDDNIKKLKFEEKAIYGHTIMPNNKQTMSSVKLVSTDNKDIPLKDIKVRMDICDQTCQFTIEQSYLNSDSDVIEAYYVFPTMANTSVYDFEAVIDGRVIATQLKPKEDAVKEYNKAISEGNRAFMMEQVDGDTFSVCLGNIPPSAVVNIKIRCVTELKTEIDATQLRLNLPLTFMPKYKPSNDASLLSTVMSSIVNTFSKPYDYTFMGQIMLSDGLVSIDSKTHPIKLSNMQGKSAEFLITPVNLDTDIVLTIKRNMPKTSIVGGKSDSVASKYKYAYQCNIIPNFEVVQETNVKDMAYMIIIDSSGSMSGADFKNAVDSAKVFISLLPFGSKFNIFEFNSNYTKFSSDLTTCTIEEKVNATNWLNKLGAGGGTEVLEVMQDAYNSLKTTPGSIIFLSDGGVSNTDKVLELVKKNKNISVFTIGIGSNVSQQLIQEMASSSVGGVSEFINNTNDGLNDKVNAQVKRALQSMKKCQQNNNVKINTNGQYEMFPKILNLYEGDVNTFHIFSSEAIDSITYNQMDSISGQVVSSVNVYPVSVDVGGNMIHRIAGVKLLNELANTKSGSQIPHLNQDPVKEQIINASLGLGILSKYTSFIGVEVNDTPTGQTTTPILKKVPLQMARKYNECYTESCSMPKSLSAAFCMPMAKSISASRGTFSDCSLQKKQHWDQNVKCCQWMMKKMVILMMVLAVVESVQSDLV